MTHVTSSFGYNINVRIRQRNPSAAMLAGFLGGFIGALFKLGWDVLWPPLPSYRVPESAAFIAIFTHAPSPAWEAHLIQFALSVLSGVAYGALVEFFPIVAVGTGVAFGLAVWLGAYEIVMPLLRLTPWPWQLSLSEQSSELLGHALWGWTIGVFVTYYGTRFLRRDHVDHQANAVNLPLPVAESVSVF